MVQAVAFSGFPWFFLSHGLSRVLPMIQISDFTGAYGTSFVAAAVSGAISDVVLARLGRCRRGVAASAKESVGGEDADHSRTNRGSASYSGRPRFGIAFAGALLMLTLGYGFFRLSENTIHEGPRVGIVQGDFLMSVSGEETPDVVKRRIYMHMLRAAAKESPDILALPESPWRMLLNPEARRLSSFSWKSFRELQEIATQSGAYLVTGSATLIRTPMDLLAKIHWYNSATLFRPDASEPGRYDKVHVVPFGEAVPFRFGRLRSLYLWLHQLMPFSGANGEAEYSVFPGESFHTFEVRPASQPDRTYQIGIPICYEDVMPYVSRIFVRGEGGRRRADLLLNISNDGWFGRGHQQPQHLAASVFRAVENRVGIARAVNTGVSALIEPTGRVHDVVRRDDSNPWPRACGYAVARVGVDSRRSTYTVYGDWFGWSCAILWLVVYLDYWILRVRSPDDRG